MVGQLLTGVFYLLFFLLCSLAVLVLGLLVEGLYGRWSVPWAERRATSIFQPFRDLIKLFHKETLVPAGSNRAGFLSMPLIGLACACLAATILVGNVFWQNGVFSSETFVGEQLAKIGITGNYRFVGDVLVVLLLLPLPFAAVIFGAACSNSPFAAVASSRGVRMLSCMLPLTLAVVAALVLASAAEQRFTGGLNRQASKRAGRESELHPRRAKFGRGGLTLRFSELLVLRGAGPRETDQMMVGRAALRMRPVRKRIEAELKRVKAELKTVGAEVEDYEKAYVSMHDKGLTPDSRQEDRANRARARYEWLFQREKQLTEDARNADWLTGTRQTEEFGLSGARLAAATRGGRFANVGTLLAMVLCVVVAVLCAAPLAGLSPFEFAESRRALAGGTLAEYGGPLLAFWRMTRAVMLVVLPLFLGLVFLGGFRLGVPGVSVSYKALFAFGEGWSKLRFAWGELLTNYLQALVSLLKFFLIVYGLALLRRGGWKPRAVDGMRVFVGPASLVAFCALFIAVVMLWSGG